MRILAVSNRYPPWSLGGYEVAAAGTVGALSERGHLLRVLTTVPDPSERPADAADDTVYRELHWYWRDHDFPALPLRATIQLERTNARVLGRHLAEFKPDAVLWWALGGMSLSLLEHVRRAGVAALGVVGDDWMVYGPEVDRWTRLWSRRSRIAAEAAQRLIGVPTRFDPSRAARWAFISRYMLDVARSIGSRFGNAVIAHPGVDERRFGFTEPGPWASRFLYCGRLDPRKGVGTAVEALANLPARATLTIDGDGDPRYRSELERLSDSLGLGSRVQLQRSPRAEVPGVYAAADAVVFPVRWREPWGLVPLEAMAVGRPVVATAAGGGVAEYLSDGENCLLFPPGDAVALAAALQRLEGDPGLRARLTDAGRRTAARFTAAEFHRAIERELTGLPR